MRVDDTKMAGMTSAFSGGVTFVVGPEKTATTFIQALLEQHEDISLPRGIKETFFFDRFFENGLKWYLARFDLSCPSRRLVEVAPSYFCEDEAILRIKAYFPEARIVLCARDLVDRTISHHQHMRRYGYINTPLMKSLNPAVRPLISSLYAQFCPKWEAAFGAERVSMLDMAVLKTDPARFATQVFEAVGVKVINVPEALLSMRANEAAQPRNFFIARLATIVSNKFKQWGFYSLLELARNSPIRKFVFGSKKVSADKGVDDDVRAEIATMLAADYAFLAEHYGIEYPVSVHIGAATPPH